MNKTSILSTLKWETRKHIHNLSVPIGVCVVCLSYLLLSIPIGIWMSVSVDLAPGFEAVLFLFGIYIMFIYPTISVIIDLWRRYYVLEKLRGQPFAITAGIKIILNMLICLTGTGIFWVFNQFTQNSENIWYLIVTDFIGIRYLDFLFKFAFIYPAIAMFSCIAGLSMHTKYSLIVSVAWFLVIAIPIFNLADWLIFSQWLPMVIQYAMAAVLFVASCWLYDNKLEITHM